MELNDEKPRVLLNEYKTTQVRLFLIFYYINL